MFDIKKNKVDEIPSHLRFKLAQQFAKRWKDTRQNRIQDLIQDSRDVWDHILSHLPENRRSKSKTYNKFSSRSDEQQGIRLGKVADIFFTLSAIQHNYTFGADDGFFRGTPLNKHAKETQEKLESFYRTNFGEANYDMKMLEHRKNAIADGTAVSSVHWEQRKRKQTVWEPTTLSLPTGLTAMLGMGQPPSIELPFVKPEGEIKEVVEWEGTVIEPLSFNDWVANPDATSFEDAWFQRRWYETTWKIKRDYKLNKIESYFKCHEEHDKNNQQEPLGITRSIDAEENEIEGGEKALLMVVYDDFVIDGKAHENHAMLILNDTEVLWFGENDYNHGMKPYVLTQYYPIPGQLYGLSALKHILPAAAALDRFMDQSLKAGDILTDPIFTVLSSELAFQDDIRVEFGETYPVKNHGAISPIPVPTPDVRYLQFLIQYLIDFMENHTGATPAFSGQSPDGSDTTAFQVSQHMQGASTKFQVITSTFNNSTLEPLLKMIHSNFQQFKTQLEEVPSYSEPLTPSEIRLSKFKWTLTSIAAQANKNQELAMMRELLMNIIPTGVQNQVMTIKPGASEADVHQLLRRLMVTAGFKDVDEVLKFIEPQPQGMLPDGQPLPQQGPSEIMDASTMDAPGLPMAL